MVFSFIEAAHEEKPLSPIMKEKYGMNVVEVNDIKAVLDYFT